MRPSMAGELSVLRPSQGLNGRDLACRRDVMPLPSRPLPRSSRFSARLHQTVRGVRLATAPPVRTPAPAPIVHHTPRGQLSPSVENAAPPNGHFASKPLLLDETSGPNDSPPMQSYPVPAICHINAALSDIDPIHKAKQKKRVSLQPAACSRRPCPFIQLKVAQERNPAN